MDADIAFSWAVEPLFYEAPHPPGTEPRPYQHAAVEYCLARDHALIGDAPGLGKTAEGILLSNAVKAKRTLVVCPASLRLNWEREIWQWSTIPNVRTYPILKAKDGVSPEAHYVIVSYDLLRNRDLLFALLALRWDHLILDEAHYLKDPKGNKRTQAICAPDALPSVVGRITMASGTILPNQPIEVYNAARLLCWDAIDRMSLESFRNNYYAEGSGFITGPYRAVDKKTGQIVQKFGPHWSDSVRNVPTNLDDLRQRLRSRFMVRRLKQHVLTQLPPRQWHVVPLSATADMKRALKHPGWGEAEALWELDPDAFSGSIPIDGAISTAKRELGEAKIGPAAEYIKELLDEGVEKVVVGAWHHTVLSGLRSKLEEYGLAYMDGGTSPAKKQRAVDDFQEKADVRVILGQVMPLGEGWTLTAASDVVNVEPYWVPGKNDQLLDRVHRFGQISDSVTGHMLVAPDSLDERVMNSVVEKDRAIYKTLDVRD